MIRFRSITLKIVASFCLPLFLSSCLSPLSLSLSSETRPPLPLPHSIWLSGSLAFPSPLVSVSQFVTATLNVADMASHNKVRGKPRFLWCIATNKSASTGLRV